MTELGVLNHAIRLPNLIPAGTSRAAGESRPDQQTDFAEAAARCQLHGLAEAVSVCAKPHTLLSEARALFAVHGLRALPVVDEELRLVGIVSRSELVHVLPASTRVSEVMRARVHALPEQAPIGYAIALMALEGISEVPVVTEEGELVGVLHALDALRWTAERLGYVIGREGGCQPEVSGPRTYVA
jgi:Mg/Co/Ni transporter MgtE